LPLTTAAGGSALEMLGQGLCALLYALLFLHLLRAEPGRWGSASATRVFLTAIGITALWSAASALDPLSTSAIPAYLAAGLDVARYGAWIGLLWLLMRPAPARAATAGTAREWSVLAPAAGLTVLVALGLVLWRVRQGAYRADGLPAAVAVSLALAVLGLMFVEQLFRNLPEDARWNAKPLCLALALGFGFDLYMFSEGLLFGRLDTDAWTIRGAVHALAAPLLLIASRGRANWLQKLQVSRNVVFHSATLLLAGGYLLFMAGVGYYVRYFGGEWGRALQLALGVAGVVLLLTLVLSGSLRSRLKVFVGKNFFSYRYDYREEWLRFTAMLSSQRNPQEVGELVVRGLAAMVECPGGALWTRANPDAPFRQAARWNLPAVEEREPADSSFCRFLREQGWVIDIDEFKNSPRLYGDLALPPWLLGTARVWLVVPLTVADELLGFVTLSPPRAHMELNWEVRDLLKTAGRQAAGYLAQMQATEALLEARKFDAFNRMSAFVVHDLKNIVTQLSLMMKNAQRLHANPEFQQDMLLTVDSSLEKMRRLMLQLREGATPPGGARGVELAPLVQRLEQMAKGRGRTLTTQCPDGLATRGHDERLERVLGHLVQNALDATPDTGRVWITVGRYSGQIRVEVGDTGEGMSEEFVQNRLFRPFSSTKHNGMGIGSYESFQYIRELGGSIDVQSTPGQGTVMSLLLPLFDSTGGSDLNRAVMA
jgi:putative PEP-CTERM system histidine kinase